MAATSPFWTALSRQNPVRCPECLRPALRQQFVRNASSRPNVPGKYKRADAVMASKRKKRGNTRFTMPNLKKAEQFSLCDAMRYIRAFEVGRNPTEAKYEVAIRLDTLKNGPVIRNRFQLPHPVDTNARIGVVADPESKHGRAAKLAGAVVVGEDTIFDAVKAGRIEFDRLLCHQDSLAALNKAGVARILGPRGLMPSPKTGTVLRDVAQAVKESVGGSEYRERMGVLRLSIGQLGFTPEEMQRNIKALMDQVKRDCAGMSDRIAKTVHEVVLSSTRAPGFSLNGTFRSAQSLPTQELSAL